MTIRPPSAALCCAFVALTLAPPAQGQDTKRRVRGAEITPLAYSTDASTVRMVPLVPGKLPDLSKGEVIRPTCGRGVDPKQPCQLHWLPEGDLLVIRDGTTPGYARYTRGAGGRMTEMASGVWPRGWGLSASGDVDGDRNGDLLLTRKVGPGHDAFEVLVAKGEEGGEFHFKVKAQTVLKNQWAAAFALAELTGDAHADLLLHSQPHGGSHPVTYELIPGTKNGTFDLSKRRAWCKGPIGASASNIVLDDFNADGYRDVFLIPDDDVPDMGQAYLSLSGRGKAKPMRPSVDFAPGREGSGSDEGAYTVQTSDVDLSGTTDLIVWFASWRKKGHYTVHVYRGDGRGGFSKGELLLKGTKLKPNMAWSRLSAEF